MSLEIQIWIWVVYNIFTLSIELSHIRVYNRIIYAGYLHVYRVTGRILGGSRYCNYKLHRPMTRGRAICLLPLLDFKLLSL